MTAAATMERQATRRFSAESAARAQAREARSLANWRRRRSWCFLDYRGPRGSVQPGDAEGVGLPGAVDVAGGSHHASISAGGGKLPTEVGR